MRYVGRLYVGHGVLGKVENILYQMVQPVYFFQHIFRVEPFVVIRGRLSEMSSVKPRSDPRISYLVGNTCGQGAQGGKLFCLSELIPDIFTALRSLKTTIISPSDREALIQKAADLPPGREIFTSWKEISSSFLPLSNNWKKGLSPPLPGIPPGKAFP